MMTSWTPTWLGALWTVAFVVALGIHLRHTIGMTGPARWWHATHVLMALGMIDMFWPYRPMPVPAGAGEVVFAVAAGAALVVRVATPAGKPGGGFLWEVTIVDLIAMTYMFAEPAHDSAVLVFVLSAWFALETVGWISGTMAWAAHSAGLDQGPQLVSAGASSTQADGASGLSLRTARLDTRAATTAAAEVTVVHHLHDTSLGLGVRITLAVMSAGMTYMLLAVHFGGMAAGGQMQTPGM